MANPEWDNYKPRPKEKTPDEVIAGASDGEQVLFVNCPCCKKVLGVYIRQDKPHVALGPIVAVSEAPQ